MESVPQALSGLLHLDVLAVMAVAIPLGLAFGVLPGLSGLTALAVLLPFVYGMEPLVGLSFLLATHAVTYTGGSITAIVLGIPGSPANAATLMDGVPLGKRGEAGYAIGAALTASCLGGIVGFAVLLLLLPLLQPLVMSFGSPETFFVALLGLTYVAILGRGAMTKGLIAGGLGVFLALFGYQRITGVPRFWLDFDYLLDGFRLIPLVLGLFAIPEIVSLTAGTTGRVERATADLSWRRLWDGAKAVIKHRWLLLRSSITGVVVGTVPGVGGDTAPFLAYASAKQVSANRDSFGDGAIEGVIAPESSNNAKEGGALVPTLALGIPGSAGMAVLLGGFLLLGLEPGPYFLKDHMDLAVALAFVLAAANVLATVLMFALAKPLAGIALVRGQVLAPSLLALVVLGAYAVDNNPMDVIFVFVFGALGYVMRELDYSRPALLLGFILAPAIETYLHISLRAYGPFFFMRPISIIIIALIVVGLFWTPVKRLFRSKGSVPP